MANYYEIISSKQLIYRDDPEKCAMEIRLRKNTKYPKNLIQFWLNYDCPEENIMLLSRYDELLKSKKGINDAYDEETFITREISSHIRQMGEYTLYLKLLLQAIEDFRYHYMGGRDWFYDESIKYPLSFYNVCEILKLNPKRIVKKLEQIYPHPGKKDEIMDRIVTINGGL